MQFHTCILILLIALAAVTHSEGATKAPEAIKPAPKTEGPPKSGAEEIAAVANRTVPVAPAAVGDAEVNPPAPTPAKPSSGMGLNANILMASATLVIAQLARNL